MRHPARRCAAAISGAAASGSTAAAAPGVTAGSAAASVAATATAATSTSSTISAAAATAVTAAALRIGRLDACDEKQSSDRQAGQGNVQEQPQDARRRTWMIALICVAVVAVIALTAIVFLPRGRRPVIAVASETRKPIESVIKQLLAKKGYTHWQLRSFERNSDALEAYRKGEVDLMMVDDPWMPELASNDLLLDLRSAARFRTDFEEDNLRRTFDPELLSVCHYPSKPNSIYALPFLANVQLLMYNHDTVARHKLKLPESLDELESVLEQAKSITKTQPFVISSSFDEGYHIADVYWQLLHCEGKRGAYLHADMKTVVIPNDDGQQALNRLHRLLDRQIAVRGSEVLGQDQLMKLFFEHDQFMAFGWPGWVTAGYDSFYRRKGSHSTKAISMHLMAGNPTLGLWVLAVHKDTRHPHEAVVLLKELCMDPELQSQLLKAGSFPASKQILANANDVMRDELGPIESDGRREFWTNGVKNVSRALAKAKARPRTPHWADIEQAIGQRLQAFGERQEVPDIRVLFANIPHLKIE